MINVDPRSLEAASLLSSFLQVVANPEEFRKLTADYTAAVAQLQELLGAQRTVKAAQDYQSKVYEEVDARQAALDKAKMALGFERGEFDKQVSEKGAITERVLTQATDALRDAKEKQESADKAQADAAAATADVAKQQQALDKREAALNDLEAELAKKAEQIKAIVG
jgi:chromosome segregation ATPase